MKTKAAGMLFAVLALGLSACVTHDEEMQGSERNLHEAARINTELGMEYLRKGNYPVAEEKLERAIEQDDDFAPAHAALALVYQNQGDTKGAKKHFRRALSLDSEDPSTKNLFGTFLCSQGEIDDAVDYFLEAAKDRKFDHPAAAWTNAGVCIRRKPDLAKAEDYFRHALDVEPQFPDALAEMARLTYDRKDYLHARAFVQRYDLTGLSNPEVLWIACQTERTLGDNVAAARYERRLHKEFPEYQPPAPVPTKAKGHS